MQAAGQYGDGPGSLTVTGDDAELLADGAKLPRMNQDRAWVVVVVGWLGQHDGPTTVVINPFGGQFVVRECVGHVACLSMRECLRYVHQSGEKALGLCGQSAIDAMLLNAGFLPYGLVNI